MSDEKLSESNLAAAHEQIEVEMPRWALDILAASAETVANSEGAPDNIRADCESAANILRSRVPSLVNNE